jgi:DNA-binding NarL/FixJ family response regulator
VLTSGVGGKRPDDSGGANSHDNSTIGLRLGISQRTARNHVSTIFSKLGVNTRAQAIVRARDAGFGRHGVT